jgi:hypothetical protein
VFGAERRRLRSATQPDYSVSCQLLDGRDFMSWEVNYGGLKRKLPRKVNGFNVLRFGEGGTYFRCFAVVTNPDLRPPDNEKQVFTDQLALMLALSAGAAAKAQVEVAYDENDEGRRLNSLKSVGPLAGLFMRSTACRLACRTVEGGLVHANRRRDRGLVRRRANRACDASTEEAAGPLQSRGSWLDDRQCVASGRQPPKQADEYQPIDAAEA